MIYVKTMEILLNLNSSFQIQFGTNHFNLTIQKTENQSSKENDILSHKPQFDKNVKAKLMNSC